MEHLEAGNRALEDGDIGEARDAYKKSVEAQKSAAALYNLGVRQIKERRSFHRAFG